MSEFKYGKELLSSIGEVFKKPILLLPFVYIFVVSTLFLFIMPLESTYLSPEGGITNYNILVLVLGFGLIQMILALAFKGMGLIGIRDYVEGQEVKCRNQSVGGLKIFWKLLLLTLLQMIVFAIPVVVLLAIFFGVYALSPIVANFVGLLLIVLFLVYACVALFFIMFSNIIVAYEGKSAKMALSESYAYAKKNAGHVFFTMLSVFLAGIVIFILMMLLYIPFLLSGSSEVIIEDIIVSLISVPLSAIFLLYLFKAFKYNPDAEVGHVKEKENKAGVSAEKVVPSEKIDVEPPKKTKSDSAVPTKPVKKQQVKSKRK